MALNTYRDFEQMALRAYRDFGQLRPAYTVTLSRWHRDFEQVGRGFERVNP